MAIRKGGSWDSVAMIKEEEERRQWRKLKLEKSTERMPCALGRHGSVLSWVPISAEHRDPEGAAKGHP